MKIGFNKHLQSHKYINFSLFSATKMSDETANLKEIILNTRQPIVLKNSKINWQCFKNLNLAEYCEKLDNSLDKTPLLFEKASKKWGSSPQWERFRKHESITVKDFLRTNQKDSEFWYAYSYKGLNEIPEPARNGIDFAFLGFPNIIDNIFFWLSSKGGHTPCHYDSYGCNVVVQVYGIKTWLLFPPQSNLSATRAPYEESSIYCYENFYSPSKLKLEELSKLNCRKVDLRPGDILIVPRNWWHYVETLETSLSINYWLPLECDRAAQIDECIVKFIVESIFLNSENDDKNHFLNPNQVYIIFGIFWIHI